MTNVIPDAALALLSSFEHDTGLVARPWWLESEPNATVWRWDFGHRAFEVDWDVQVVHHSLRDSENSTLYTELSTWVLLQTSYTVRGRELAPKSAYNAVTHALRLCDYILLNADELGVEGSGLGALTRGDMKRWVSDLVNRTENRGGWLV